MSCSPISCHPSIAPPPPCRLAPVVEVPVTVILTLAAGEVPVLFEHVNVYVRVPAVLPVTVNVPLVA